MDQALLELFSKLKFPAGVGTSEYWGVSGAPWSQGTVLSYFTSGAVSGRGISGSSHPLNSFCSMEPGQCS